MAFLRGRGYVVPEDVKEIAHDVLRHRILLTYEAEAENVTTRERGGPRPRARRGPLAWHSMLDRETLQKVRRIRIRTRTILESGIVGSYHAVFKGRGHGVRRGARVRAGRRRAHHRLERHRPHGRALRQDSTWRSATSRCCCWSTCPARSRSARASCSSATTRPSWPRCWPSRRWPTRTGWARCCSPTAWRPTSPRARGHDHALRIVRDLLALEPQGRGTDLTTALRFARRGAAPARHRGRHLRLPGHGLRAGAGHPARAPRRDRAAPLGPGRGGDPGRRPGGPARSRDGRAAGGGHVGPRRAPPAARVHARPARRRRSAGRRSTPWPSPRRSRTSGRWPRSSRRGRSGDEAARAGPGAAARGASRARTSRRARWSPTVEDRGGRGRDLHRGGEGVRARRAPRGPSRREAGNDEVELRTPPAPPGREPGSAAAGHAPLRGRRLRAGRGRGAGRRP